MQTTLWREQEGTTTVLQLVTVKAAKNLRLLKKEKKKSSSTFSGKYFSILIGKKNKKYPHRKRENNL